MTHYKRIQLAGMLGLVTVWTLAAIATYVMAHKEVPRWHQTEQIVPFHDKNCAQVAARFLGRNGKRVVLSIPQYEQFRTSLNDCLGDKEQARLH